MREIEAKKLRHLEGKAREIAKLLDAAVNKGRDEKSGFCLFLFSFEGPEFTYVSNAQREDMIKLLEEILARWKVGDMNDYPGGVDAQN
jgi:hypothetical protein